MTADITGDGLFTISDVWGWLRFVGCFPGNKALHWMEGTAVGRFFEISDLSQYSASAWVISVILWLIVLSLLSEAGGRTS